MNALIIRDREWRIVAAGAREGWKTAEFLSTTWIEKTVITVR